jgi:hypothetical protein
MTQYSPDGRWYWDGQRWLPAAPTGPAAAPAGPAGQAWPPTGSTATTPGQGWPPVATPGPAWARPFESPRGRATAAIALVGIASAGFAVLVLADLLGLGHELTGSDALQVISALIEVLGLLVYLGGLIGSAIAVPMWVHRAYRNLPALGAPDVRSSPAWGAGAWFVPIANLFVPPRFIRELWERSGGGHELVPPTVALWWAAWVGSNLVAAFSARLVDSAPAASDLIGLVGDGAAVAGGLLFIQIIRHITSRQVARAGQYRA